MGFPVKSRAAADFEELAATIGRIDILKPDSHQFVKNKVRTLFQRWRLFREIGGGVLWSPLRRVVTPLPSLKEALEGP
jgi:hypothetical protein